MNPEDARNRDLTHGALWLIGGIVVTAVSYMAAAANGEGYYILAWGAVLGGAAQFLQGLLGSYSKPEKTTKPTKRGGSCKACQFSPVVTNAERCPRCNISDPNPEAPEPRVSCLTLCFAFATAAGGVAYGLVENEIGLAIILGLIGFFVGIGLAAVARIGVLVLKWMFG